MIVFNISCFLCVLCYLQHLKKIFLCKKKFGGSNYFFLEKHFSFNLVFYAIFNITFFF